MKNNSALPSFMITLNVIMFLVLFNATYSFVNRIASDLTLIQYKSSIIHSVEMNAFYFEIYTDSEVFSQFCHPMLLILIGIMQNIIYFIVKRKMDDKKRVLNDRKI